MKTHRNKPHTAARHTWSAVLFTAASLLITGCALGPAAVDGPFAGASLHGTVFGGQQPVLGAVIQLYAANTTGYNKAASALIGSSVTTDSSGAFSITGKYTCPSGNALVYITATGGDAGAGNNPNLAMMTALGQCGNLTSSSFVYINEVTTVASVWALSPFMVGVTGTPTLSSNVASSSTNVAGLQGAFDAVLTLANTATGAPVGPNLPTGAVEPTAEINTLADILATCVNSAGGVATDTSTPCGRLFSAANSSSTAPTDTISAALNISQHPDTNVTTLYNLATPTAPFQPGISPRPTDFTLALVFSNLNLSSPSGIAIDAAGDAYIASQGNNSVVELLPSGTLVGGTTNGLFSPAALAIDTTGFVWVANNGNSTLAKLSSGGALVGGSTISGGGLNLPVSLSFDTQGNVWVANSGAATISEFSSAGAAISPVQGYNTAGSTPLGIAVSPH